MFDWLFLKRFSSCQAPKKEDDIDGVDSGAGVIDGELEVKNIAITFYYDHKRLRFFNVITTACLSIDYHVSK